MEKLSNYEREHIRISRELLELISESTTFLCMENTLKGHFYPLFSSFRRSLYTAETILNEDRWENSYLESLPLARTMLERYFHMAYILKEYNESAKLGKEYEDLGKFIMYRLWKYHPADDSKKFLSNFEKYSYLENQGKGDKPRSPLSMARDLDEEDYYNRTYSYLNSFIHYNPHTNFNYGSFNEDGVFVYNDIKEYKGNRISTIMLMGDIVYRLADHVNKTESSNLISNTLSSLQVNKVNLSSELFHNVSTE
ncbi:hypothetical protein HNR44_003173 [Geomicrobium halophilum]|uniref:Uncharacterized protein n=1 Tax=Geomicrobium halophilum TaxID=549000 RepID=A0A841PQZ5_9BACL|nr:DUF5677 domain-containing protein [Geomicrobium halophilum]MBB6451179.1 hypothetical protein [Geomicrobium halophilum]